MSVTPPLDKIPKLAGQVSNILIRQITDLINRIFEKLNKIIQDLNVLPEDCKCDNPRVHNILKQLEDIQNSINRLQDIIPIVNTVITTVQTAIGVASAIKAAQLLNPATAPIILATESVLTQNLTIQAAIAAAEQLAIIPSLLNSSINSMSSKLGTIVNRVGQSCPGTEFVVSDEVQNSINSLFNGGTIYNNPDGIGWGTAKSRTDDATLGTEFYSDINVSESDLESYTTLLKQLVEDQRNLLTSVQEAPAQSYNGSGSPDGKLGKPGDYYVDTTNQKIYGPKTNKGWPSPVNY